MTSVTTNFKRSYLRTQKWASEAASPAVSLYAQLKARLQTVQDSVQETGGLLLTSTSTNGHSVGFSQPSELTALTPSRESELISELLDRWETAVEYLELAVDYTATTNDAAIFSEMMARLKPVRKYGVDLTGLRTGPVEVAP